MIIASTSHGSLNVLTVKNTLAAETLAMINLAGATIFYRKFILEILDLEEETINVPIICDTNNSSLPDVVYSFTQILHKRLHIQITILRY